MIKGYSSQVYAIGTRAEVSVKQVAEHLSGTLGYRPTRDKEVLEWVGGGLNPFVRATLTPCRCIPFGCRDSRTAIRIDLSDHQSEYKFAREIVESGAPPGSFFDTLSFHDSDSVREVAN